MIAFSIWDLGWMLTLLLLSLAGAAVSLWRFGTVWTPLALFVGVNCLSLSAYHLRLLDLIDLSVRTHCVVLVGLLAFAAGCLIVSPVRPVAEPPENVSWRGLRPFFLITAGLSLVGWVVPLLILEREFTLAVIRERPWLLQDTFQMRYLGYLNLVGILVLPSLVLLRLARRARALDYAFVVSSLIGLVLAGIKQFVFFAVVAAVLVHSVRSPRRPRLASLLVLTIGALAFFVFYQSTIDVFTNRPFQGSRFTGVWAWLEKPYLYFVGSWPALEKLMQGAAGAPPVPGFVVLQPLWKVLGDGLGLVEPVPAYLPFVEIGGGVFNVYSFVGEVFWDLGLGGVVLVCLLHGAVTTRLFAWAATSRRWLPCLLYGVVAYSLVNSFFAFYLKFNLVVLVVYTLVVGATAALRWLPRGLEFSPSPS